MSPQEKRKTKNLLDFYT